jgi:hypothetical protein
MISRIFHLPLRRLELQISAMALVALVAFLGQGQAQAATGYHLTHEMVFPNPATMQETKHTVDSWHQGNKYRRFNPMTNEAVVIDLDNQKVFGINDDAKTFWELPMEQYRPMALMPLMVMGVRPMPDGSVRVPDNLFKPTGKVEKIGKFKSYEVTVNAQLPQGMSTSFWLSESVKLPKEKLISELKISLAGPTDPELDKLFSEWRKYDGYPVRTVTKMVTPNGQMMTQETLIKYKKKKISAKMFLVPKGYKKTIDPITRIRNMQQQMQQQRPGGLGGAPGAGRGGFGGFNLKPPSASGNQPKRVLPRQ